MAALLLTACAHEESGHGFRVDAVRVEPGYRNLSAQFDQHLRLSREAATALDHGVPLHISIDMELRDSRTLALLTNSTRSFELRYLPLSRHYRLTGPEQVEVRTFPRLRHALGALSDIRLVMDTGALAPGRYEFRTRVRLERSRLPAPMQLPARFSAEWRLDSSWSTWPFRISA
ncbi:MAG: DUF4390 domain-containing protein [Xanthomonadales bacterium]|nr:DUF4390 domain-containing protein [Xanthomonadales bacterium]NIN60135.1 DUF4390 domain-containing protein [Xanthomonadales bacterium]NIN74282.1 DUF4390 domain-containing protein [Xanthomonadales bacterium]NIO12791.1 DUF4390 domain-containing protein [Xanthomonadales bacterium]NIP12528.1 DUF4390 domain-containing protein [Xanthomonadales bacterium]